jgi:tetratricopeptide (TPR) repeat protein
MKKAALFLLLLYITLLSGCCFDMGSKENRFKKRMLCARRVNNDYSISILKKRAFCCPQLPQEINDIYSARIWYYKQAADIDPQRDEAYAAIGQTYWLDEKFSDALVYYCKSAALVPDNVQYLVAVTSLERIGKDYEGALKTIGSIGNLNIPDKAKTVDYLKGKVLYDKGDISGAGELLTRAMTQAEAPGGTFYLAPTPYTMKDVYFYLAMISLKKDDAQKAYEYFLKYLAKEGHPDFVNYYQDCLQKSGGDQTFLYEMIESGWTRTHQ